jgi:hypothetical protein
MTVKRVLLWVLAATAGLVPIPPFLIENVYSTTLYVPLQTALTTFSNLASVSYLDVASLMVAVFWLGLAVRDLRVAGWLRGAGRIIVRGLTWAAAGYIVFLIAWGFNYRRVRLSDRLPYDARAVTRERATQLALTAAARLNALHAAAHAEGWLTPRAIDPALAGAFERTAEDLGSPHVVVARPKTTLIDWYFKRAGVDGLTDPFFLETIVAADLLPFERPFVVAHEWSHLAGLADEGEANFGGWLTCMRASTADQYSGWVFLYSELARALPPRDRSAVAASLGDGPRADLRAIRDRVTRQVNPRVSAAGWRVYDSYLRANRVEAGSASYGEVVRLALGLRLAADAAR